MLGGPQQATQEVKAEAQKPVDLVWREIKPGYYDTEQKDTPVGVDLTMSMMRNNILITLVADLQQNVEAKTFPTSTTITTTGRK